jgi:hypothetical protein
MSLSHRQPQSNASLLPTSSSSIPLNNNSKRKPSSATLSQLLIFVSFIGFLFYVNSGASDTLVPPLSSAQLPVPSIQSGNNILPPLLLTPVVPPAVPETRPPPLPPALPSPPITRVEPSLEQQEQILRETPTPQILPSTNDNAKQVIDLQTQSKYRGYTFWSSDLHISPIADLKSIFTPDLPFAHKVIDKSLSGHCKIMKPQTCATDLRVFTSGNSASLVESPSKCINPLRKKFYDSYKNDDVMKNVDAFLCNHNAPLCEAFMAFGRPMVIIASTRYEIGRYDKRSWNFWNKNLLTMANNPRNIVAANNRYDAEYIKYFTGLEGELLWGRGYFVERKKLLSFL